MSAPGSAAKTTSTTSSLMTRIAAGSDARSGQTRSSMAALHALDEQPERQVAHQERNRRPRPRRHERPRPLAFDRPHERPTAGHGVDEEHALARAGADLGLDVAGEDGADADRRAP